MNNAPRSSVDADDYRKRASARIGVAAFTEIHGRSTRLSKMKADIAVPAAEAVRKTGWLPPVLRTARCGEPDAEVEAAPA